MTQTRYIALLSNSDNPDAETFPLKSWPTVEQAVEEARSTLRSYGSMHGSTDISERTTPERDVERCLALENHGWTASIHTIAAAEEGDDQ
jgi:hypothetical protein